MARVTLAGVSKKYGKTQALDNISLDVKDREFLVILGPSGAGKTTLLNLVAGVIEPTAGEVFFDGEPVGHLEANQRNVAMAFESYALYPNRTVYENIAFPLQAPGRKLSAQEIDQKVKKVAEILGITHVLEHKPGEISNGQKQRTSLGRAMVRNPRVLLLDEPLSHLDAKLRHHMRTELKALQSVLNTTTLYVTHDYLEALALADRVAVINHGKLEQLGTRDEVFGRPANTFVAAALGQPEINLVAATVKAEGTELKVASEDGLISLPVPAQLKAAVRALPTASVTLGVRPIHAELATDDGRPQVHGHVYAFERFGTKGILTVTAGQNRLVALLDKDQALPVNAPVTLGLDAGELMLFHPETGRNLAYA
ncbi:MAG TPA: ABC transporter ATP-binding protein [Symbiobacteriaceae bacterium]|nr:ABC transporter ATP-binding protein [Symbiobacteriaceae bacterium]